MRNSQKRMTGLLYWRVHELKLTLQEVADKTGLGVATISCLERGIEHNPGLQTMIKLAECYKVSFSALTGWLRRDFITKKMGAPYG